MNNGFDGFFLRDDVPDDFDLTSLNQDLNTSTTISDIAFPNNKGLPIFVNHLSSGYANNINIPNSLDNLESQDEAIGLLMGMALVVRCLPYNSTEYSLAQQIAYKMVLYMRLHNNFVIELPCDINGESHPQKGHNAWAYQFGFEESCNMILGNSVFLPSNYLVWNTGVQFDFFGSDNRRMAATLAAISDSWTTFGVPSTGTSILNLTWGKFRGFYVYLWKFLHNKSQDMTSFNNEPVTPDMFFNLCMAPCGGPYYYHYHPQISPTGVPGWSSTDRLWSPQNHDGDDGFKGAFSGLDYMLMYNLYALVNGVPVYSNMNERRINNRYYPFNQDHAYWTMEPLFWITIGGVSYPVGQHLVVEHYSTLEADENNPYSYAAFNTIETNAVIDTKVHISSSSASTTGTNANGHVTMVAGKMIHLKPGFHAKKGSYFHAYIQDLDICSNNFKSSDSIQNQNEFTPIEYNDIDPMPGSELVKAQLDSLTRNTNTFDNNVGQEMVFYISPNPGNGLFTIQSNLNDEKNYSINIINGIGTIISMHNTNSFPFTIDISNKPAGIYFIEVTSDTNTYKLKYIKQ